jgi:hypothetical protein
MAIAGWLLRYPRLAKAIACAMGWRIRNSPVNECLMIAVAIGGLRASDYFPFTFVLARLGIAANFCNAPAWRWQIP